MALTSSLPNVWLAKQTATKTKLETSPCRHNPTASVSNGH